MENKENIRFRHTPAFKLKDKQGRDYQGIDLKKQFGFLPEFIIIQKVSNSNNKIVVSAVLTKEEIEKEDKLKVKENKDGK